jgi:hypothetical protein
MLPFTVVVALLLVSLTLNQTFNLHLPCFYIYPFQLYITVA